MIWDSQTTDLLKLDWVAGHSTAEIGRRLGISKNAVVGRAHRLGLDARPSPIRRDPFADPMTRSPKILIKPPPTLPILPSLHHDPSPPPAPLPTVPIVPAAVADYRTLVQPPPKPIPITRRSTAECCWPIGMPGTKEFRFCAGPSLPGKPYCDEHAKLAYAKVRDRREEEI